MTQNGRIGHCFNGFFYSNFQFWGQFILWVLFSFCSGFCSLSWTAWHYHFIHTHIYTRKKKGTDTRCVYLPNTYYIEYSSESIKSTKDIEGMPPRACIQSNSVCKICFDDISRTLDTIKGSLVSFKPKIPHDIVPRISRLKFHHRAEKSHMHLTTKSETNLHQQNHMQFHNTSKNFEKKKKSSSSGGEKTTDLVAKVVKGKRQH